MPFQPRHLFRHLLERLHANDLQGFENMLTEPSVAQAFEVHDGLVFLKVCKHPNMDFVRASLPHALPEHIGAEFTYCMVERNIQLFETLVQYPTVFDHMRVDTLHLLAHRCYQHNTEHDMLEAFLTVVPECVVQQQLQYMRTSQALVGAISLVENLVAQQQKERLEHEIETGERVSVVRKI